MVADMAQSRKELGQGRSLWLRGTGVGPYHRGENKASKGGLKRLPLVQRKEMVSWETCTKK